MEADEGGSRQDRKGESPKQLRPDNQPQAEGGGGAATREGRAAEGGPNTVVKSGMLALLRIDAVSR